METFDLCICFNYSYHTLAWHLTEEMIYIYITYHFKQAEVRDVIQQSLDGHFHPSLNLFWDQIMLWIFFEHKR